MKKLLIYIVLLVSVIAVVACQKEPEFSNSSDGTVTINFSVRIPDADLQTKSFGDVPDIVSNGLYVLVYESGYRVEVSKATIEEDDPFIDSDGSFNYKYSITLTSTENKRNLHFISYSGFDASVAPYEETRIGTDLITSGTVDAYWQMKTLNGISTDPTTLASAIGTVTLVRNFAKITMAVNTTNVPTTTFVFESYKVFNTPNKGYVAPYAVSGTNAGKFVVGYHEMDYDEACAAYKGRVPVSDTLNVFNSTADEGGASFVSPSISTFMYERPAPTDVTATFIVVKGYYDGSTTPCYYKINLCDNEGNYYALLRDFRFKISIDKVTGEGFSSVADAIKSPGSGNISTSLEYSSINNISDGNCRLIVSSTSITTIKSQTVKIKYKFISTLPSTVNNGVVDFTTDNPGVNITIKDPENTGFNSITTDSGGNYEYSLSTGNDSDGYRTITLTTTNPENVYKEQVLLIKGQAKNGDLKTSIQREIHIIVRPTLKLGAKSTTSLNGTSGQPVTITFGLEPDLPESIFPLNVKIEAEKMTLTPDTSKSNNNMPVESGTSDVTGLPSFHFVKTVTYADYTAASTSDFGGTTLKSFNTYFVTNTGWASTDVNVSCDLFNPATCELDFGSIQMLNSDETTIVASGQKVYGDYLVPGMNGKLTVYLIGDIGGSGTVKAGDVTLTLDSSATAVSGYTAYSGTYTAPSESSNSEGFNDSLTVTVGGNSVGTVTVPVYGISVGTTALSSASQAVYNQANGTGWYVIVNDSFTAYHLNWNGSNINGVQTSSSPYSYSSLFGFSATGGSTKVAVPSANTSAMYYVNGNNALLGVNNSGTSYSFNGTKFTYVSGGYYSTTYYWRQNDSTANVYSNSTNSNNSFNIYPVSFDAP